ncbi:MAG: zinc-binding dehydrogenase [Candidatus Zixiibacteriota bacterium]
MKPQQPPDSCHRQEYVACNQVIGRKYSLGEVPQAIRYVEEGHTRGKVVVTVRQ